MADKSVHIKGGVTNSILNINSTVTTSSSEGCLFESKGEPIIATIGNVEITTTALSCPHEIYLRKKRILLYVDDSVESNKFSIERDVDTMTLYYNGIKIASGIVKASIENSVDSIKFKM